MPMSIVEFSFSLLSRSLSLALAASFFYASHSCSFFLSLCFRLGETCVLLPLAPLIGWMSEKHRAAVTRRDEKEEEEEEEEEEEGK